MSGFEEETLSHDKFLGGRITLWQPRKGYRAGIDPVLLAASIPAKSGQSVLELGCGIGTALFCLGARVPDLKLTGLELQPDYATLARRNAEETGLRATIHTGALEAPPAELKQHRFDHVFANPPYFHRSATSNAIDQGRLTGRSEETALSEWVKQAAKRAAPGGTVTFIHRAERLDDLLSEMATRLKALRILPIVPRVGKDARLVMVQGRTQSRAALRLHSPLVLHEGDSHDGDRETYTNRVSKVLRDCAALDWSP